MREGEREGGREGGGSGGGGGGGVSIDRTPWGIPDRCNREEFS